MSECWSIATNVFGTILVLFECPIRQMTLEEQLTKMFRWIKYATAIDSYSSLFSGFAIVLA